MSDSSCFYQKYILMNKLVGLIGSFYQPVVYTIHNHYLQCPCSNQNSKSQLLLLLDYCPNLVYAFLI